MHSTVSLTQRMYTRLFSISALLGVMLVGTACQTTAPVQSTTAPIKKREPIIAVALGGGGAKGFAHIGALKILESNGIKPNIVTGTSAGSFVGSLYASGMSPFDLQKLALNLNENDLMDFTLSTKGLFIGEKLQNFVNKQVANKPIEQFPKRFAAVATRVDNGKRAVFTKGNVGQAVRASCSIPNVFLPAKINGIQYVDGGLVSPIPVSAARELGADIVIAIDISARPKNNQSMNVFSMLDQTINIMALGAIDSELSQADVVIKPTVGHIGVLDLTRRQEAILEGEQSANAQLANIKASIERFKSSPAALQAPKLSKF